MNHPHPDLGLPTKLVAGGLRIVALGGLGEIGRNMTVFESEGKLLVVDCGVLFPEENQPGIDLILPDFSYIRERLNDIEAIFLTHGHEDHIGAVPYLLRERGDIPVIGTALTVAFIKAKLKEHRITAITREVKAGMREKIGPFSMEYVAVNHSIPDALAVAITTKAGTILHTGDFKMDQLPLDGRITDLATFARLGADGVDLFMVDSTNADIPGFTTSEREIMPALDRVFRSTRRRVVVASFASHVHRIQQIINTAESHKRKVIFMGRSMVRNMNLAAEMGYLTIPSGVLIDEKEMDNHGDNLVLICTGSQGEPLAALSRMANGDHQIRVGEGDTVVLASSLIPGNENPVYRVINELTRFGARVVHKANALVHVSGHAAAGELLYCYNIVKPKHVMPIHGEWRHMRANAELAIQTGVARKNTVIVENGIVIDMVDHKVSVVGSVPCGFVYVDGQSIGDITESSLKDRRILGEEGFISVIVVIDSQTGKIVAGPDIHARGFAEDTALFDEVKSRIEKALAAAVAEGINGTHQLSQIMRKTVGSWVGGEHRRRPMIVPVVIEV
ncbi:MAG: ribonuclease J [Actinobacteria bacterium]|nr:ribonuclease J [Actinomycetota bacterium]NDH12834.1 ribonuclease J [Actinomycetota bacterium]TRZ86522.1 MAG: ribonuclease J [Streptomycetaceae bacterium]